MLAPLLLLAALFAQPSATFQPPAADPVAELSKGSALYRVCQAEVRLMDLPSLDKASQSDLLNGSYCVGYMNGFVANLTTQAEICPQSAPMSELVRAYVDFIEKHTELLTEDRRLGVSLALRIAFPCPGKAAPPLSASGLAGAFSVRSPEPLQGQPRRVRRTPLDTPRDCA